MTSNPADPVLTRKSAGRWQDEEGVFWITQTELTRRLLFGRTFADYWTTKQSRHEPWRPALRWAWAPHGEKPWHARPVRVFHEQDANRIVRGEEGDPSKPGAGRPRHPLSSLADDEKAKGILARLLAKAPKLKLVVIQEARDSGVSRRRVYQAAKALKVRRIWSKQGGPAYWALPHQEIGAKNSGYAQAAVFLKSLLQNGPRRSVDVKRLASEAGLTKSQLYQGMRLAGVRFTRMSSWRDGGPGMWFLPEHAPSVLQVAESRTKPQPKPDQVPLPIEAYPVYIVQPANMPIPVVHTTPAPQASAAALPSCPGNGERAKPSRERHLKWKRWKDAGASYGEIVQRERDDTGREVTTYAVAHALKRLKKATSQGVDNSSCQ
jgi:hypothetical protein